MTASHSVHAFSSGFMMWLPGSSPNYGVCKDPVTERKEA